MTPAASSRLPDLVSRNAGELLAAWLALQRGSPAARPDLVGDTELEDQSKRFIAALETGLRSAGVDDTTATGWDAARDYLRDLSRSRAIQGFKRLGTAVLVLAVIPLLAAFLPSMIALVGNGSIIAIALFALIGLVVGHALGGANDGHLTVLAIATASRHPAVALAIARANFPNENLAPAAILLDVLISTVVVTLYYRRPRASSAVGGRSARHPSLKAERA